MILLHRHSDAGALIGADSPELPVAADEERLSPLVGVLATAESPVLPEDAGLAPEAGRASCEVVSDGAVSEGVWSAPEAAAVVALALVCWSALTAQGRTQ